MPSAKIIVGTHVKIGAKKGIVRFIGETSFATGEWYGIELEVPKGKNNGTVNGEIYFTCEDNYGLFCKKAQVRLDKSYKGTQPTEEVKVSTPAPTPTPTSPVTTTTEYNPIVGDIAKFKEHQGTIAFVGTTEFSTGIWCGLVLKTPDGKNDGTVKGKSYFTCQEKHGLFVKPEHLEFVSKSEIIVGTMTKDNKQEEETKSNNKTPIAPSTSTSTLPSSPSPTKNTTSTPSTPSTSSILSAPSSAPSTPPSSSLTSPSRTRPSPSPSRTTTRLLREQRVALESNNNTIKELRIALENKDKEIQRLETQATITAKTTAATLAAASSSSSSTTTPTTPTVNTSLNEIKNLNSTIKRIEKEMSDTKAILNETSKENEMNKISYSTLESKHNATLIQMKALEKDRTGTVTSQAERLAKISKAERRSLELEEEMSELHDMVENLSFEKEEIQLEKEIVEQTLVDVRMELAQRDGEIENYKLGGTISTNTTTANNNDTSESDDVHILREQNGKLREALLRLRDTSTLEKANLEKEMLVYKKQFENMNDSNNKMNELIKENGTYKNQIGILKDQVDDARAFETLVEDLTEKNLDYYEKNAELIGTVSELEELREISEEVEAHHVEFQQQLQKELLENETKISQLISKTREINERHGETTRDLNRCKELTQLKMNQIEVLETKNVELIQSSTSLAGQQTILHQTKYTQRDLTRKSKRNELSAKTSLLEASLSRYETSCLRSLVPSESTGIEERSIETLVLLKSAKGKIQIVKERLHTSISNNTTPTTTTTTTTTNNNNDNEENQKNNGNGISHPYLILCARVDVLLSDAEYFLRVLEIVLYKEWGITDVQFLNACKSALPVEKQLNQLLDNLMSTIRKENSIDTIAFTHLETTVSSMANTVNRILNNSTQQQNNEENNANTNDDMNSEDGSKGGNRESGVNGLKHYLGKEEVVYGITRLWSISSLLTTVLHQHQHGLMLTETTEGITTTATENHATSEGAKLNLMRLIDSHCIFHQQVTRTKERLLLNSEHISTSSSSSMISLSLNDMNAVSKTIHEIRMQLTATVTMLDEITPGNGTELYTILYNKEEQEDDEQKDDDEDEEKKEKKRNGFELHQSICQKYSLILTNSTLKTLSTNATTTTTNSINNNSSNTIELQEDNGVCPSFERQARLLRERISTATQLEQDQKALKKTLAKRIQEVYMKQRELDTVGVRCEKLKKKVDDSNKEKENYKIETENARKDALRESKHFEEAVDELNRDVDRLEAENRRMRKQLGNGDISNGTPLSQQRSDKRKERRRRDSEHTKTTDQLKRDWKSDAKGETSTTSVNSPNKTDTSSSSSAAEDLLALRRVLNTVVTENVRLRAASIRSRLKRMKRLPTTFNYTASQARAAAITPLKTLSNPAITPSPSSPSTASTGSTKSTENNSINIDSTAIGSTATVTTTSATALRTNQKMNLHLKQITQCNHKVIALGNVLRMQRATRTVIDLSTIVSTNHKKTTKSFVSKCSSVLSKRKMEDTNIMLQYQALEKEISTLNAKHSIELGYEIKDFGNKNYALVHGGGGGGGSGGSGVARLRTGVGNGMDERVIHVQMNSNKLKELHRAVLA